MCLPVICSNRTAIAIQAGRSAIVTCVRCLFLFSLSSRNESFSSLFTPFVRSSPFVFFPSPFSPRFTNTTRDRRRSGSIEKTAKRDYAFLRTSRTDYNDTYCMSHVASSRWPISNCDCGGESHVRALGMAFGRARLSPPLSADVTVPVGTQVRRRTRRAE